MTGELLHDEAFAADKACAELLAEKYGQLNASFRCQEAALLHDHRPIGSDLDCPQGSGELRCKSDHSVSIRRIAVLEQSLARKHAPEHLASAAANSLHLHVRTHPAHGA